MSHIRYSSVEIKISINVIVFESVPIGSEFEGLVRRLKEKVEEFDGLVADNVPTMELKKQAATVNATYGSLADLLEKSGSSFDPDSAAKAIDTAAAVIDRYDHVAEGDAEFGEVARDRLTKRVHELYHGTVGRRIDDRFMWDLKFYEWVVRKKLLSEPRYQVRYRRVGRPETFTEEELEIFFRQNEGDVLRKLLMIAGQVEKVALDDPIGTRDYETCYKAFKALPPLARE